MPNLLIRQYSTSIPPPQLSLPVCSKETCDTLVSIIRDAHLTEFPPSTGYRTKFFKRVVDELEARADYPIDECIYETFLASLQTSPSQAPSPLRVTAPSPAYKTHYYPLYDLLIPGSSSTSTGADGTDPSPPTPNVCDDEQNTWGRLTVFESPSLIEAGTTGLRTWRASLCMGEWLLCNPDVVRRKRVLELGSGTGFLGILIAQIQLRAGLADDEVWLTDCSPQVLLRCEQNIRLSCNKLDAHKGIHTLSLDWTSPASELQQHVHEIRPDVVVACDVIFYAPIIPELVGVLKLALTTTASEAWIAIAVRNEQTLRVFVDEAENAKLDVKPVDWQFVAGSERVFLGGNEGGEGVGEVKLMRLTKSATTKA